MKSFFFLLSILMYTTFARAADTTLLMKSTAVKIVGNEVSSIHLVNHAGKQIGRLVTYASISSQSITITQFSTSKEEGVYFICVQTITPSSTKGLLQDITVQKAFIDPEMKTNPKQYWEASIAFKQKNGEYMDVGSQTEYRLSYENETTKTVTEQHTGTSRLIPFRTKAAADAFVKKIKPLLKS
jgi:hypothetical protein